MNNITWYNIQDMIKNNQNFDYIINDIDKTIKENDLNINIYNNLTKQLAEYKKNIIAIYKKNNLIAFAIISENVISNIYINKKRFYKKYFDILIDESIEYLDNPRPIIILSKDDVIKYINYILNHNWNAAAITKNNKIIFNDKSKMEKQIIKEYRKF